jgi:hypothetical protein
MRSRCDANRKPPSKETMTTPGFENQERPSQARPRLAWDRRWIPRGQVVPLGWGGIAEDPASEYGQRLTPNAIALDALDERPIVALEGDAGLGKSITIRQYVEQRADRNVIYLRAIDLDGPSELTATLASLQPEEGRAVIVYIDGIDEAGWAQQSHRLLALVEAKRLHLRLVCRAGGWPRVLETELVERAPFFFELLPLTRAEIAVAAASYAVQLDRFLEALHAKELAPLAQRPLTLLELLETFRSHNELPQSRTILFRSACRRYCEEHNEAQIELERSGAAIGLDHRLRAVQRTAAYSVLCNRPYIVRGAPPTNRDQRVLLSDLAGTEEFDGVRCTLSESDLRTAIQKCQLISPAAHGTSAFGHRTFAEHLAAAYLHEIGVPLEQVRSLLCHERAPDRVVLQLAGVASELCAFNAAFARWIAQNDPRVLLAADLSGLGDGDREAIVAALVENAAALRVDIFASRLVLRSLNHARLADQLRSILGDAARGAESRVFAIDLAVGSRLAVLAGPIADIAIDAGQAIAVRHAAARAVVGLEVASAVLKLKALLVPSTDDDDQDLRAYALEALWPDRVDGDPFDLLEQPLNDHRTGLYDRFLCEELPTRLSRASLPRALEWLRATGLASRHAYAFEELSDTVFVRAWEAAADAEVRAQFVPLLRDRLREYEEVVPQPREGRGAAVTISDDVRRTVVVDLCDVGTSNPARPLDLTHSRPPLLAAGDLAWALERAVFAESDDEFERWAIAAQHIVWGYLSAETVETLLVATEEQERLRARFASICEAVELGSDRAKEMIADQKRYEALSKRNSREEQAEPAQPSVADMLDHADANGIEWFPSVLAAIAVEQGGRHANLWSTHKYIRWLSLAPEPTKTRTLVAAERFLGALDDRRADWIGTTTRPFNTAHAGYLALVLLAIGARNSFAALPEACWSSWVGSALEGTGDHVAGPNPNDEILRVAYTMAPDALRVALRAVALGENEHHKSVFALRAIDAIWDPPITALVLELLQSRELTRASVEELLDRLTRHDPSSAQRVALELLARGRDSAVDSPDGQRAIGAGVAAMMHHAAAGQPALAVGSDSPSAVVREIVERIAERAHGAQPQELVAALSANDVSDLYLWLSKEYPHAEDPDIKGAHAVSKREAVADFREGLLRALAGTGRAESVDALRRVQLAQPERNIAYLIDRAADAVLRDTWTPITPTDLRDLLQKATNRRADTSEQLLEIVVEKLEGIQTSLHGTPALAPFLWNDPVGTSAPEHKDEAAFKVLILDKLYERLEDAIIVRELEIRQRLGNDRGQEPDGFVVAPAPPGSGRDNAEVAIEAKGDWHRELKTAMQTQLADRYLAAPPLRCGIYLVGFFGEGRADDGQRLTDLRTFLANQAKQLSNYGRTIRSVVLDCRLRLPTPGATSAGGA